MKWKQNAIVPAGLIEVVQPSIAHVIPGHCDYNYSYSAKRRPNYGNAEGGMDTSVH